MKTIHFRNLVQNKIRKVSYLVVSERNAKKHFRLYKLLTSIFQQIFH